ncbi:MAG: NADH-quinone oxidoreductase subunit J [Deltaproteobacteria bacterium]|nr:NADH-quinone oxidoreductase subunit J [Deltaproteobacteria bacterium]
MALEVILFWICSVTSVVAALFVILHRNPILSALALLASLFAVAGLFITLQAPFLAAIQILIYAGAVMVLFIFVIMLLNLQKDPERFAPQGVPVTLRFALGLWVFIGLSIPILWTAFTWAMPPTPGAYSVSHLAELLFDQYLLPFELTSFLLLVAMVGGVVLAKKS